MSVAPAELSLRPPEQVMRLSRMGVFHQCRLSFMRQLTRRMQAEAWRFTRPVFEVDARGVGHAVYCAHTPHRTYSLIAFAHDLPADQRSDRVIAEAWDSTFTLFDGVPDAADIARLAENVPLQEAGRITETELSLSRANRSVRLWDHVVSALAEGHQPDGDQIDATGYLMRTTAVYGSGKFGAVDREQIADRPEFMAPFQVEMLSVYLTRTYVRDLVQHMADQKGDARAATLDPALARRLGIGNSTGLGMAPFLLNHPALLHNWMAARETALARVRAVPRATPQDQALFGDLLARSVRSAALWRSEHPVQVEKLAVLRADLDRLTEHVAAFDLGRAHPWDHLYRWADTALGEDAQECLASLMPEPYGALVDDLAPSMSAEVTDSFCVDGRMDVATLRAGIEARYGWALAVDWTVPERCARAWYVSAEKLEPRLGERHSEPIEDYEQPLAPGRDIAALHTDLAQAPEVEPVAAFLLRHPHHRYAVRRVQITRDAPYAEIRDNTIDAALLPIDMLRCKLSFFGATHFDPRSDRWVRICLYRDAPYPEDLAQADADFWPYPPLHAA